MRTVVTKKLFRSLSEIPETPAAEPSPGATPAPAQPDNYTERLIKYIPTEVITLWVTFDAIMKGGNASATIYWIVFVFGILATWLYLNRIEKVNDKTQLLISVGAFCVWVFALGAPFSLLSWYEPLYASLLLPAYTFLIPVIGAK